MRKTLLVVAAAAIAAALSPAPARAQVGNPFDHLKCYKIKDPLKAKFVADLVPLQNPPFSPEPGCVITTPAKLFCIPVQKTNVRPTPIPGTVNGVAAQDYLVYKIKCPNVAVTKGGMPLPVSDQFGARTVLVGVHQLLLVPAFKQANLCHNTAPAGAQPVCGGDCTNPSQQCVLNSTTNACDCESPCGLDTTGQCSGTCPFPTQNCHFATQADGTLACSCNPPVDGCVRDPASQQCGGPCPEADETCVTDVASGTCQCEKPCGATGLRMCGGTCPPQQFCRVKPDDSGCECAPSAPQPCGMLPGSTQCGGTCPNTMVCIAGGPVPGPGCVCGVPNQ